MAATNNTASTDRTERVATSARSAGEPRRATPSAARATKGSTISTLSEDYVTVAQARGIPDRRIVIAYVGRNAMLPLFTQLAISIGFVVGGSVVIENIFQYPGIGLRLVQAINGRDYTVMQGVFVVITIAVVLSNIAAELLYGVLDPRVRVRHQ